MRCDRVSGRRRLAALWIGASVFAVQTRAGDGTDTPEAVRHDQLNPRIGSVDNSARLKEDYVLGPDDQVTIHVANSDEFGDAPFSVEGDGTIKLPMAGRIRAAGLTTRRFEEELTGKLRTYFRNPDVSVSLTEYRSQPVSVTGAVGKPGVLQVKGSHTLLEMISEAGGLRADAGSVITLTRRAEWGGIPLSNAVADPSHQFNIVRINVRDVTDGRKPEENITVRPFDVIAVPKADQIYVVGDVEKAGGFFLNDKDAMSVLQALALAGGARRTASLGGARILRASNGDTTRAQIPVDLKAVMNGKAKDLSLYSDDILLIPSSAQKQITSRAIETAITLATGVVIWGRY